MVDKIIEARKNLIFANMVVSDMTIASPDAPVTTSQQGLPQQQTQLPMPILSQNDMSTLLMQIPMDSLT